MAEDQVTTSEQTLTPPVVTPGNAPEARNPDGSIKDQQATPPADTPSTSTTKSAETSTDDKSKTDDKAKAEKAEPGKVPEKYEFKVADGQKLDERFVAEATPVLKELGLTNDQAQKLMSLYDKQMAAQAEAPFKAFQELQTKWRTDVFKDPALGDGTGLKPEIKASVSKLIDSFPNATQFREAMEMTGAGNNPEFVKAMAFISKELGEGTSVLGRGPSKFGQVAPDAKPKSMASAMYPNLKTSSEG